MAQPYLEQPPLNQRGALVYTLLETNLQYLNYKTVSLRATGKPKTCGLLAQNPMNGLIDSDMLHEGHMAARRVLTMLIVYPPHTYFFDIAGCKLFATRVCSLSHCKAETLP